MSTFPLVCEHQTITIDSSDNPLDVTVLDLVA
jgi:hypothetical protein